MAGRVGQAGGARSSGKKANYFNAINDRDAVEFRQLCPPGHRQFERIGLNCSQHETGVLEMKKVLVAAALLGTAASAQAADLARKAPMLKAPPMAIYDWTGFYIGVNGGISVARDRTQLLTTVPSAEQSVLSPFGGVGGGQIGYNWQVNSDWLLGVESDIQASGETTNRTCLLSCTAALSANLSQKIDWFGTTRARIGLVDGPSLTYFTGGVAYGHYSTNVTETTAAGTIASLTSGRTGIGYTYGSGIEASLGGNWTGKIEYLYVDLGSRTNYFTTVAGAPQTLNTRIHDNIFRAGVNYRFGGTGMTITPPTANWAGFYIGANVGSLLGRDPSTLTAAPGFTEQFHLVPDGYAGGGQIGYNWQAGAWVFGLEADLQGSFSQRQGCLRCFLRAGGLGQPQADAALVRHGAWPPRLLARLDAILRHRRLRLRPDQDRVERIQYYRRLPERLADTQPGWLDGGRRHRKPAQAVQYIRPVRPELDRQNRIPLCRSWADHGQLRGPRHPAGVLDPDNGAHLPRRHQLPLQPADAGGGGREVLIARTPDNDSENPGHSAGVFVYRELRVTARVATATRPGTGSPLSSRVEISDSANRDSDAFVS